MTRQTHTYSTLEVSPLVYDEISEHLRMAGALCTITDRDNGKLIDMSGLALVRGPESQDSKPVGRAVVLTDVEIKMLKSVLECIVRCTIDGNVSECKSVLEKLK